MTSRVSIIIPHFNGREILHACLKSIKETISSDDEIILVDNNSSDDSVIMTEKEFPHVIIKKLSENLGFAGGCNYGIKQSKAKYICILNNDTVQNEKWLDFLVEYLEHNPEVASVMPKLLSYHQRDRFDYSGGSGGYMDKYAYPFVRGRLFDDLEIDRGQYDTVVPVFWCSGTAFVIRKSVLDEIGLFDTAFFAHMEEIDLHWRLHLAGYAAAVV
ncbi:MAG: glycosyltransferase family 2 protein, partial [Candidatus Marinimicrobia bacterium]|nr:glycosyltransferase family 2 protein [Candidatus Neomarinimicrobiota bacterium]